METPLYGFVTGFVGKSKQPTAADNPVSLHIAEAPQTLNSKPYMSHCLNSLKGYIGDYMGDYYRGYQGGY